ncbi:serine hydrolase domain-containing protein [Microterricola pindariensis]|uniref:Beta-lactamase-related domain-containing protein n=1 Tax=Microterricola pindariensis TaxID=478010 RepID=A0ABX5AYJ4_9MICO|nr:serine hydrolase domain-containing protein [Microterricola pindariensis]PPL19960.1 hypothetical protein GY24_03350 [Microterricola pindariensis]
MTDALTTKLDAAATRAAAHRLTGAVLWRVERTDSDWSWTFGEQDQPIFIASITKLYTTVLVLRLVDAGLVDLDKPAADYLPAGTMQGLNTHGGVDHGGSITVRQLLSQTSGLADYFEGPGGFLAESLAGDLAWTPDESIERTRRMPARFAPGTSRAHYSDTNFTLLGLVIEQAGGQSYRDALDTQIFRPLGLGNSYLFDRDTMQRYDEVAPFFSKGRPLRLPLTLASCGSQGAIVSTLPECTRFLRAFLGGELFDPHWLPQLTAQTNSVFGPLRYGLGVMQYTLPRVFSPLDPMPRLVGHSGSIGSVLYYAPEKHLVIAGTVNQMDKRQLSHQVLARIASLAARD